MVLTKKTSTKENMIGIKYFSVKFILLSFCWLHQVKSNHVKDNQDNKNGFKVSSKYLIEGKVFPFNDDLFDSNWLISTRVIVNYGQYLGFLK